MFADAFDERGRHVDAHGAHLLRRAVMLAKVGRKAPNRLRVTAGRDEYDAPSLHIGD